MISLNNSKNCATKRDARSGFENENLNAYKTTLVEKMDHSLFLQYRMTQNSKNPKNRDENMDEYGQARK